jgi:hypothetical protein
MEKAYLENDRHEMEITRPIRLSELQAKANLYNCQGDFATPLDNLKANGDCEFALTNEFFVCEFEGHSFQRIKDVRVAVKLRNTFNSYFLNAELSLVKSEILTTNGRIPMKLNDTIMATSLGHIEKTGEFSSYNSEKASLFEGYGAISQWSLEIRGLDKEADNLYPIDDVLIYLTYTARKGG